MKYSFVKILAPFILIMAIHISYVGHAQIINTIAGNGTYGYWGDGGIADSAELAYPNNVIGDKSGNIYISDGRNNRIRKINISTGIINTIAGNGITGFSGDGNLATSAELNGPSGIALDDSNNIYFADCLNQRIRKISATTGIISTIAGNGFDTIISGATYGGYSGDGGLAISAKLNRPQDVYVDHAGNVYIQDAFNWRIRKVNSSTGIITTIVGNGIEGYSGDEGLATSAEIMAGGMAIDASLNIYIADQYNQRIRKVSAISGIITTIAGNGFGAPSTGGFSGDGGPATSAELNTPLKVAVDTFGNIFFTDGFSTRIREVSGSNNIIRTIAGTGTFGYSGDGGAATLAELNSVGGISCDMAGNVYVADVINNRIREITGIPVIINNVSPFITISSGSLIAGQTLVINGHNFTPSHDVKIVIFSNNSYQDTFSVYSTPTGTFTYGFLTDTSMHSGIYTINAVDSVTGIYAPVKSFVLNSNQISNTHLTVLSPLANDTLYVNDTSQITWQDKMVLGQNYPVNGAHRGYSYIVEYSDNNGSTWQPYTTLQGSAYINSINTFHVPVAFSNVGNGYYVRVIDYYNTSNRDSGGVFIVVNHNSSSNNIKVQLYWDFSYNNQNNGLYGVAADGDARLFLVVSKIDSSLGATISSVSVQLNDNWNSSTTTLGKVMAATQVSSYGEEANAANSLTATQNTEAFSRYWFWFVAPDDFVGNNSHDLVASDRNVNARFVINYSDGSMETVSKNIKIVRPPLCFVHGLASDPSTWFTFSSTGTGSQLDFLNDPRFYTSSAIQIDASQSFNVNAQYLTLGFSNTNSLMFQNSLQGVIKSLRDQGYASNRCDYICHSMGGNILRYALDNYDDYFNRTGVAANKDYKNYQRGYVNKVITLATPHNGSPWADILNRYVGQLGYFQRLAIEGVYDLYPNSLPFSFITQDQFGLFNVPTFKVVDAVTDLQIDSTQGGIKFNAENIRAHLITAGIFPGVNYNSSNFMVPQPVVNLVDGAAQHVDFLNDFAHATIANEQDQQVVSDLVEIGNNSTNPVQTALQYMERMADFYNIAVFIPSSDLVVSKSSALADNSVTAPNVSVFDNYIGHAFINPILNDIGAGNEVNTLLNTPISSNDFGSIAASSYILPPHLGGNQRSANVVLSIRDTSFLKIISPANGANLFTDSIVDIRLNLRDTSHIISLNVRFQNKTYKLNPIPGMIDLNTQINSNILDSSIMLVEAFYKNGDSSIFYYDSLGVNVSTTSSLMGFAAQQKILYLNINQEKFPDYVSYYQGFTTSVGNFSKHITATVANNSIASFDPIHKGFRGVSTGETYAIISYKGLKDTLYLVVGQNPIDSVTTGIKSIPTAVIPDGPKLFCYPNPFSQVLNINFEVTVSGTVSLKIYDLFGRVMVNLLQGQKEQGQYQTAFDGSLLPEGMYLCELRNEDLRTIKKIVVVHSK